MCDVCVCACVVCSPVVVSVVVNVVVAVDVDVGEEPEDAGAGCSVLCTPPVSVVLRDVAPVVDAAVAHAAGKECKDLKVEADVAVFVAAAAVVAAAATACLEVDEVDVCEGNPEAKASAANPGG